MMILSVANGIQVIIIAILNLLATQLQCTLGGKSYYNKHGMGLLLKMSRSSNWCKILLLDYSPVEDTGTIRYQH